MAGTESTPRDVPVYPLNNSSEDRNEHDSLCISLLVKKLP